MKIVEGNSYVCLKEWKDVKGHTVPCGAICHASKDCLLHGYNSEDIYCQVEPLDNYEEYFTLYEESPYNQSRKELREKYAGMALQAILSDHDAMHNAQIALEEGGLDCSALEEITAVRAIAFADALIEALKK